MGSPRNFIVAKWPIALGFFLAFLLGMALQTWRERRPLMSDPCVAKVWSPKLGTYETYLPYRRCVEFGPAREFSGVWVDEFEGSAFHAGKSRWISNSPSKSDTWLEVDDASRPALFALAGTSANDGSTRQFMINFRGRKALASGSYGHLGSAEHLILIDQIQSVAEIKP